jgi:hypothetical protein
VSTSNLHHRDGEFPASTPETFEEQLNRIRGIATTSHEIYISNEDQAALAALLARLEFLESGQHSNVHEIGDWLDRNGIAAALGIPLQPLNTAISGGSKCLTIILS